MEEVHWIDTWDSMVRECQEEVVQIHFDALRDTLDRYLHVICHTSTIMCLLLIQAFLDVFLQLSPTQVRKTLSFSKKNP